MAFASSEGTAADDDGGRCSFACRHTDQQQRYFRAHRIDSTLIRDPATREARLDLWKRWGCGPVG
jgi:hypothetical protein